MTTVKVRPNDPNATHKISLNDGMEEWGIEIAGGVQGVQESPNSPSNIRVTGGGSKYGDFDPSHSHLEQRTWEGGRAAKEYWQHETQFFDSMAMWTLTPETMHAAPQWSFGEGYQVAHSLLPGAARYDVGRDVKWQNILSSTFYVKSFTANAASTCRMTNVQAWVRRVGTPEHQLTVAVYSSATDKPGTLLGSATLGATTIEEGVSQLYDFTMTSAAGEDLGQSTAAVYWVAIRSSAPGTNQNHWEFGYSSSDIPSCSLPSTSMQSADGTTYSTCAIHTYFRVSSAAPDTKWTFFTLDGALYAADRKPSSTQSIVCINGDRGEATAGTTASLTHTGKTWSTGLWANSGAWVKITRGTGAGQKAQITANTSEVLTAKFDVAPGTDSEYVIYGTNEWTALSSAGLSSATGDNAIVDIAVANNQAFFAVGATTNIGVMRWNSSVHEYDASTNASSNGADFLHLFYDPVDGAQLWRGISSNVTVSRSTVPAFGSTAAWTTGVVIGDQNYPLTELADYNDQLYAFKEDSLWTVKNDRAAKLNVGLEAMPSSNNGACWVAQNFYLYFPWSHSVERLYSGTLDDIGPWKGEGLPDNRRGVVASLIPVIGWFFAGIDASTGISSVLAYNNMGWHELFRAWKSGKRVQSIYWQPCPGTNPRLWISVGGDLVCMKFPKDTLNPLRDSTLPFQHEAHLITGTFDMGVSQLPKLFHEVFVMSRNLGTGKEIYVDYQLDDEIGGSSWIALGRILYSPSQSLLINEGDKFKIRLRFRILSNTATSPPVIDATILKGVARTPAKRQWVLRAKSGTYQVTTQGLPDHSPDDFYLWLQDAATTTKPIHMRSIWKSMDDIWVYVEPPVINREYAVTDGAWGGTFSLVLREI